jgi:catechol 2,3-dioxygenase-like lactoylglutathione lyase family enzyme
MKITEFSFIGYPVTDMSRARAFYEGVLGLTCTTQREASCEFEVGPPYAPSGLRPHAQALG